MISTAATCNTTQTNGRRYRLQPHYVVPFNTGTNPQKRTGLKLLNAGGYVGFGPVRLYAQYLQRENENPFCSRPTFKTLWFPPAPGGLLAITAILGGLQINSYDIDTMRGSG